MLIFAHLTKCLCCQLSSYKDNVKNILKPFYQAENTAHRSVSLVFVP